MKQIRKKLEKIQALVIAFAVVFSFGFSAAHSYSGTVGEHDMGMIQADSLDFSPMGIFLNCDGHEDHCDSSKAKHSHVGECCTLLSFIPVTLLQKAVGTNWTDQADNLVGQSTGPLLRPPRLTA